MKKYLILLLLVAFNIVVFSQKEKVVVKGAVRSRILATDDDNAIPGVSIKDDKGKTVGKTDTYGEFEFKYSKSLLDNKMNFTFSRKEFKFKSVIISTQSPSTVYLDCEDDKYLREVMVTVYDVDNKIIPNVTVAHSYYKNNNKTDELGQFMLRAPNPRYMDNWENKGETHHIVISLSKNGYVSNEIKTSYSELKEPISITLESLPKIELVFKNDKDETEKHQFVNLESLKGYVISIKDKYPLLSQLIQDKIDLNPDLLVFDMLEDQNNIYVIEIEDENGVKKKHKFVNLNAIEDYILELRKINPELANKLSAQLLDDADLHMINLSNTSNPVPKVTVDIKKEVNKYTSELLLKTVLHDFNEANHSSRSGININDVISLMKENPFLIISIESHTDSKGNEDYNMNLSRRRASSARAYLIRKGISGKRIKTVSFGEDKPVAPNNKEDGSDNEKGRELNRRTEFKVVSNIIM